MQCLREQAVLRQYFKPLASGSGGKFMRQLLRVILLLAFSVPVVFGQQSAPRMPGRNDTLIEQQKAKSQQTQDHQRRADKDDIVKISVTLVQVDAVVTDKNGRQVT